eukprot:TRINITY_DN708_c0_g2_i1.p1 TRINITY_DN708_c0_g2~~TRINITY_DN708_c0_g2_i1.p1  ORF type:complete len:607 (+),score=247.01 TRINITY_DN708_c0_g2_i1:110-1930(+)
MEEKTNTHHFVSYQFNKPTWCLYCSKFIWGVLYKQGRQCKNCKFSAHSKCWKHVVTPCELKVATPEDGFAIVDLIKEMMDPTSGVEIRERRRSALRSSIAPVKCFIGSDAVLWITQKLRCERFEACSKLQAMLESKLISHQGTDDKKIFLDGKENFYAFETDNITKKSMHISQLPEDILTQPEQIIGLMKDPLGGVELKNRSHGLRSIKHCFSAEELIDWMILCLPITIREEGIMLAQSLIEAQLIECAEESRLAFSDSARQLYKFSEKAQSISATSLLRSNSRMVTTSTSNLNLANSGGSNNSNNSNSSNNSNNSNGQASTAFGASRSRLPTMSMMLPSSNKFAWHIEFEELEFETLLGKGCFGVVHKGKYQGTPVAIKQLLPELINNEEEAQEFLDEITTLCKLRHPNVVLFIGACLSVPHLCIVTEFCTRGSLFDLLHIQRTEIDFLSMTLDSARGLNYLHLRKPPVIHRDLKTANFLVDASGAIKIADFGLTCVKGGPKAVQAVGTVSYMAPEMLMMQNYDEKVDIYSFGVCMWEMIVREIPFYQKTIEEIAILVLQEHYQHPLPSNIPLNLRTLICDCWNFQSSRRPTFSTVITRLEALRS